MYSPEQVAIAEGHLRSFIRQNRLAVKQYESFLSDYKELDEVLINLPQKIRHPIMVPVSTVGFMEGYIEQGNELTVLLGDNYFVKCTASHARSILKRRIDFTESKAAELEEEYRLVKSRVGLAREWLEVADEDYAQDEAESGPPERELKLPGANPTSKPKIEVISSVDHDEKDAMSDLEKRRERIRELEASGVDLTDEELARVLGAPIPDFPGELQPIEDEAGVVEILEHHKPDGTIETFLTPKGAAPSKPGRSTVPEIQERVTDDPFEEDKVSMAGIMSSMKLQEDPHQPAEEPPKRVSKFKAMRAEQNR